MSGVAFRILRQEQEGRGVAYSDRGEGAEVYNQNNKHAFLENVWAIVFTKCGRRGTPPIV